MQPLSPFKAALIGEGFFSNTFQLDLNMAIEDPAPRFPHSRMFKWPVSVDRHEDRLTVCHPLMLFEPFVMSVAAKLGVVMEVETEPAGGLNTIYHHCGDLASDAHYKDLIATIAYVTRKAMMRGIVLGAMGARLSTRNARELAALVGAYETEDRSAFNLSKAGGMLKPAFIDKGSESGKLTGKGRWAVNLWSRKDPVGELWAAIHGIEDEWFKKEKYGYFCMSESGLERHNVDS